MLGMSKKMNSVTRFGETGCAASRYVFAGFSLVELMVSIAVGLAIMAGVINIYANTVRSSSDTLKMARLDQELRTVMAVMARNIRRAGYSGGAVAAVTGPSASNTNLFTLNNPSQFGTEMSGSCLMYTYDDDGDGFVDDNKYERHAFRLKGGLIQGRKSGTASLSCSSDTGSTDWEAITDNDVIEITQLRFTLNENPVLVGVSPASSSQINVRNVNISLTGKLKNTADVSRTLTEIVHIPNDVYTP